MDSSFRALGKQQSLVCQNRETGNVPERRPGHISLAWQLFMAVGFGLFFCPASYAVPGDIFHLWQFAVCAISAVAILLVLAKNTLRLRWFVLVAASFCYFFISGSFGDGSATFTSMLFGFCRVAGVVSLLEYGLEKNERKTLLAFIAGAMVMCAVNYATFILYHDVVGGMRHGYIAYGRTYISAQNWFFFTHDNGTLFCYLPALSVLWYYSFRYSRRLIPISILISSAILFMYIFLWSATAMVVTALFLASMILCVKGKARNLFSKLNYRLVVLIGLGFCLLVVGLNTSGLFDYFASIFGKASTTGVRAIIWERAFRWFSTSPIIGVGFADDLANYMRLGITHCHNVILQPLYTGGIVTAGFFAWFLWLCQPKGDVPSAAAPLLICVLLLFIAQTFDFYLTISVTFVPFVILARAGHGDDERNDA